MCVVVLSIRLFRVAITFLGNFMFMRIWEVVVNEITMVEMVKFG